MPTSSSPTNSACHAATVSDNPVMVTAATAKPSGIEPPSPRKMRAGEAMLCGRNPRHAPASAPAVPASQASPSISPSTAADAETTNPIVPAAPSMLSNRLKALTTRTTHMTDSARSTAAPAPTSQPEAERPQPERQQRLDDDAQQW